MIVDLRRRPAVVALVSSTGGLDATSRVLAGLGVDCPAAIVVLQHQSPEAHSRLASILQTRTALPVLVAREGDRLLAGRVLVAPTAFHTLITPDRRIALIASGDPPPYRPSADLLLTTLALAVGRCAVAVVLSGHGNDGATGATAVHRFGGVVIAGDEATSAAFGMPSATIDRADVIDHVVPVDDIGALVMTLVGPLSRPAV
jgi:two-component system chemotaxis response regulator CheB